MHKTFQHFPKRNICCVFHLFYCVSNIMNIFIDYHFILKISETCFSKYLKQFLKSLIFTFISLWNINSFLHFIKRNSHWLDRKTDMICFYKKIKSHCPMINVLLSIWCFWEIFFFTWKLFLIFRMLNFWRACSPNIVNYR